MLARNPLGCDKSCGIRRLDQRRGGPGFESGAGSSDFFARDGWDE